MKLFNKLFNKFKKVHVDIPIKKVKEESLSDISYVRLLLEHKEEVIEIYKILSSIKIIEVNHKFTTVVPDLKRLRELLFSIGLNP